MSNRTILQRLINEIEAYEQNRSNRDAFAKRFSDSIEALEGIPYSLITEMREWQYKIETEGYFDDEDLESKDEEVIPRAKAWVKSLIENYS